MKKTLTLFLAFVCCLFLSSCGKTTKPQNYVEHEKTPFGAYNETLTLETVKNTQFASMLSKLTAITGETLEDNRWIRCFEDKLNVKVEYSLANSGEAFTTAWQGMLAQGEYPDFAIVDYTDYKSLVEADLIYDVTDLYGQYLAPITKTVLDEAGEEVKDSIKIDGKMYGIPMPISQYDSYKYLWIRRDWMKKVGVNEAPKTNQELVDLMTKFAENKDGVLTGGNTKKKTYAFALSNAPWVNLEGFFWCYDAYSDGWIIDENGKMINAQIEENMKKPLGIVQDFFKKGYLDKEYAASDRSLSQIANGQCGIYMGPHYMATTALLPSYNNDKEADWAVFPWPGDTEDDEVTGQLSLERNSVLVAFKKTSNSEVIFKLTNVYYEMLYGETGDYGHYGNDEVDLIWEIGPLYSYRPNVNIIPYRDIMKVLSNEMKASDLKGISKDYYESVVIDKKYDWIRMWGNNSSTTTGVTGGESCGYYLDKIEKKEIKTIMDQYIAPPVDASTDYGTILAEMSDKYFTDVFTGNKNTTSDFDNFVKQWYEKGGTILTKEVQEWKDSLK